MLSAARIFHDFSLYDYECNGFSSQLRPTMRVVKNRRSRNNVPDKTIQSRQCYTRCNIPPRSISSYRASNYAAVYDKTGQGKVTESGR